MYVFRAKDGQKGQKLKLNVTAKKSRNYRKIPFFYFHFPWGNQNLEYLCQRLPAVGNEDIDDVDRWTLRYRYGNKRYFPACYCISSLFRTLLNRVCKV